MTVQVIKIPRWFDRHLHPRDGVMMRNVLPQTLMQRPTGAVIIGNLKYPDYTSTIEKTIAYRDRIIEVRDSVYFGLNGQDHIEFKSDFKPCMTCYLTDDITPEEIVRGFKEGVWCAAKLYLTDQKGEGGTTNSSHGVRDLLALYPVIEAM